MKVREIMPTLVRTIGPDATLGEAFDMLRRHEVRQLPVVDAGRLVGIVTDRDLRRPTIEGRQCTPVELYRFENEMRVRHVMATDLKVVHPDAPIVLAARMMLRAKVGGLPVVDDRGRLVGIVTTTDLLAVLVEEEERVLRSEDASA
jgi:acetoin utilization protein AcuB